MIIDKVKNEFPDYVTFARTFENYKWYKPLLVFVVGLIVLFLLFIVITIGFSMIYGIQITGNVISGGYDILNTDAGSYFSYASLAILIPSLYIASRIIRDRPFSSYSSSRGGWNWKIYLKCLIIPLVINLIYYIGYALINGRVGPNRLTIPFFIICLILVPLQCIAEEYLFRGFIMQTLGSWIKIPIVALIIQAVLFTAGHMYSIWGMIGILFDGVILGFLAMYTKGLEAGSALHTVNNLLLCYLVALGFATSSSLVTIWDFIPGILIPLVSIFVLFYVGNKYKWFDEKTNESNLI